MEDSKSENTDIQGISDQNKTCDHDSWEKYGPFYTIILYPDFSYKVCACIDDFPEEPNFTRDGYSCVDWDFLENFWIVPEFILKDNQISAKYGMTFNYTDYSVFTYRHEIIPFKNISLSFNALKLRIKRLFKKKKFYRKKNRNILAEYIKFEYRKDPYGHNEYSDVKDVTELPRIYGPVLILSNTCWRTMDYETCKKAITMINSIYKQYTDEKYIKHLETCD